MKNVTCFGIERTGALIPVAHITELLDDLGLDASLLAHLAQRGRLGILTRIDVPLGSAVTFAPLAERRVGHDHNRAPLFVENDAASGDLVWPAGH